MITQELKDFYNYIKPIVTGCAGVIRTDGYIIHFPGTMLLMSNDETLFSITELPIIHNVYLTARINTLLSLDIESVDNLYKEIYFVGYNIKHIHAMNFYNLYKNIDSISTCIYDEPDCFNIDQFAEKSSSSEIDKVKVSDGNLNYIIPCSNAITHTTKADSTSLKIYNYIYDPFNPSINIKTGVYSVYKKKFKLCTKIFYNILLV